MYAIFKDGPKQYRVEKGAVIEIDRKLKLEGEKVEFPDVLVFHDGEKVRVGTPTVSGVTVLGEVVQGEKKGVKLRVYKYRRREGYHRMIGHRQKYTVVRITDFHTT